MCPVATRHGTVNTRRGTTNRGTTNRSNAALAQLTVVQQQSNAAMRQRVREF